MPTPIRIDGWVTVELVCLQSSQIMETVFVYKTDTMPLSESFLTTFANQWLTAMTPLLQPMHNLTVTFDHISVKTHFKTQANTAIDVSFPPATFGTASGAPSPNNASLAVKLMTGIVGRSYRGRQFMFGISDGHRVGSSVTSTYQNFLSQMFNRHLLGFTVLSVNLVPAVASRKLESIRQVVRYSADSLIDSQRRRLIGRGR